MTTHTISVAFFGSHRPMHWSADTFEAAYAKAKHGLRGHTLATVWLADVQDHWSRLRPYQQERGAYSRSNGFLSIDWKPREHDTFLDSVTAKMPEHAGIDYSVS